MSQIDLRKCHVVVADLLDKRIPHLPHRDWAEPHIAALQVLRGDLEDALDRDAEWAAEEPIHILVELHAETTHALGLALAAHRENPLADAAERKAAARLFTALVQDQLSPDLAACSRAVRAARPVSRAIARDLALVPEVVSTLLKSRTALGLDLGKAHRRMERDCDRDQTAALLSRRTVMTVTRLRCAVYLALRQDSTLPGTLPSQLLDYADQVAPVLLRMPPAPRRYRERKPRPKTSASRPAAPRVPRAAAAR